MKMLKVKEIIIAVSIMGTLPYFVVCTLLQYNHTAFPQSKDYVLYNVVMFLLQVIIVMVDVYKRKFAVRRVELICVLTIFVIAIEGVLQIVIVNGSEDSVERLLYFGVWSVPGLLMGLYLAREERWKTIQKYFDIYVLMATFVGMVAAIGFRINGWTNRTATGETYGDASYHLALAYGINLYLLLYGTETVRFKFARKRLYRNLQIVILAIDLIGIVICAGRGALILACLYSVVLLLSHNTKEKKKALRRIAVLIVLSVPIFSSYIMKLVKSGAFEVGIERFGTLIGLQGSGATVSSNIRLDMYRDSFMLIGKKLFSGYGYFTYVDALGSKAHNLFLELLLQGGLPFFIVTMIIFVHVLVQYRRILKHDVAFRGYGMIGLFPAVLLMFSGSYITNGLFFFMLGLILGYKRKNNSLLVERMERV